LALIREATLSERSLVADITRRSYAQYEAQSDPAFWVKYEKSTETTLLTANSATRLILEHQSKIAASVLFCDPSEWKVNDKSIKNPYPEMRLLAVLPEFRNLCITATLIDYCEQRALAAGFSALTLHTTILMQTAKAMYERRGYQRYLEIDFEPTPGFHVWGYKKDLKV
jgi:GNAT superfamily N-acetyltransferase